MPDDAETSNKTTTYYINKRIDSLENNLQKQLDQRFDSLEKKLDDHLKCCDKEMGKLNDRVIPLEDFKSRSIGATAIVLFLIGLWKLIA